jgi:UDP-N-acetylglucosamine--N-acetylmuramyl-(pentapeptide) pyrophosphoryl-undecaprenol N-acetylglucosamine transferase
MRILISGGGTGGHTSPAIAIVQELRRRDPRLRVLWLGKGRGIEARVAAANDIPFRAVPAAGWPRRASLRRLWTLLVMGLGVIRSALIILAFRPQLALGTGGYVSLPVLWAAQRLGVPTVLHEQNKRLGLANRLLARRAATLFLSYPDTIGSDIAAKTLVSGNPVRAGFLDPPEQQEARARFHLDPGCPTVLVCGGSQGAQSINRAIAALIPEFAENEAQFLWMTGSEGFEAARAAAGQARARSVVMAFIDDMPAACAAADIVVSRAGASTAAEIAVMGKPAIFVPYPHATDAHQEANARAFVEAGAAILLDDAQLSAATLGEALRALLHDSQRRDAMAQAAQRLGNPLAGETIAMEILNIVCR